MLVKKQCINCQAMKPCLIIVVFEPLDQNEAWPESYVNGYDETLRLAICRPCLGGPLNALGSYITRFA